ncbi:3-methyl-2-oxobutanoate hydroxymethyltransferase [Devosia sp. SL43]|uniref:3-methyl-2-oxobutanoate hydroxymethyltransferase n=1 Tax=Devosia sp. SL43 TaxID=2806348 RepID=UPI001EFFF55B|nr:3-methyl-2-oxobutanoate hydroxymethyltransferase [Devosia sp. SL43]UJW84233.1 3-methyl-2-oxobutanoate hydroxymethyltransferase [Devosia sp. SL43]
MSATTDNKRLTIRDIHALRRGGEKIAMLTAYDYVTAGLVDQSGVDIILVGDSLGNVVLGYETTLPVTLDDMIRHASAVYRGTTRAMVVCDLPFGTARDPETALSSAITVLQQSGCQAVKIEGGGAAAPIVARLVEQGIPVMGHIGLTPQAVHQLGGYYKHGRDAPAAQELIAAARDLQKAGAFALVLEFIVPEVAAEITRQLDIPTIGIGSGPDCAGQVLVINDLIGLNTRPVPGFARPRADVAAIIRQAVGEYVSDVKQHATAQTKEAAIG